ncbi:MAG: hypothetical protein RQ729_00605 [Wenzhouxiangellaceae bacterium]|nr:hypothetical protein [Wenzhouxiangellaceae bacterium]
MIDVVVKIALPLLLCALPGSVSRASAQTVDPETLAAHISELNEAQRTTFDGLSDFMQRETEALLQSAPLPGVAEWLGSPGELPLTVRAPSRPTAAAEPPRSLTELLVRIDQLEQGLAAILPEVSAETRARLNRALPDLLARTSSGSDLEEVNDGDWLAGLFRRIDPDALEPLVGQLLALAEDSVLIAIVSEHARDSAGRAPVHAPADRVEGDVYYWQDTPSGAIVVGAEGPNRYFGNFRLIVDPAGDDEYHLSTPGPARVILDGGGDDRYSGDGLAGTVLGLSLLYDRSGNDRYFGGRISQGAAVAGVAVLVDDQGDDDYSAHELAQGAGLAGIGLLLDGSGHDRYRAARLAQGFGGARGKGWLVDRAGDDDYIAGFTHPSSYGTTGQFQAFAQGAALGYRHDVAGGIGTLLDQAGNDRYRAGNYAQGAGYYFGFGRLIDHDGDDDYRGGRYAQGAAAHLGIGLLHDQAGDDRYHGRVAASQAGAWDLALAVLIDRAGRDHYRAHDFGQAAAAQNSIAILVDPAGPDCFQATRDSGGYSGPTDYHDEGEALANLAVFKARSACPEASE